MQIEILACGTLRDKNYTALINEYIKRTNWPVSIKELPVSHSKKTTAQQAKDKELNLFIKHISKNSILIALDEHGASPNSLDFSKYLSSIQDDPAYSSIQFLIGGAFGLHSDLLKRAHKKIAFGQQTWPHMMVRLMLVEQIYRAEQIIAGHPYHKE